MMIALALVILGGLLYLEALRGWLVHRAQQFDQAIRDLAWTSVEFSASTYRLADSLRASQHAWGVAVDLAVRDLHNDYKEKA